ncbi:uncharacterized protein LOC123505206 isoform X2 [Portunus trituberculatus]|uniref:uncharacterized protein LOC123505206 isoform X2 n=1 Tax=Portunus trituberculatus TaxID=210409 RepID=UPI001E1CFA00|nr:uncharacterized protein LOC123505206 isoform X2 [Portunus trituberculatus]
MVVPRLLYLLLSLATTTLPGGAARTCYHCRVREHCLDSTAMQLKRCAPSVNHCVKKVTHSRVTGVVVTERYCGGRDFLNSARDRGLVEDRCYVEEEEVVLVEGRDRRTSSTVCFCSTNMCNGESSARTPPPPHLLLLFLFLLFVFRSS